MPLWWHRCPLFTKGNLCTSMVKTIFPDDPHLHYLCTLTNLLSLTLVLTLCLSSSIAWPPCPVIGWLLQALAALWLPMTSCLSQCYDPHVPEFPSKVNTLGHPSILWQHQTPHPSCPWAQPCASTHNSGALHTNLCISRMTVCLTVWKCPTWLEVSDVSESVWNQMH